MRTRFSILSSTAFRSLSAVLLAAVIVVAGCEARQTASPRGGNSETVTTGDLAFDDAESAAFAANGAHLFVRVCAACHGPSGIGRAGLGKQLQNSSFIQSLDDDELLAFIKRGRNPGDPLNTTGRGMPAKGGSPALTNDDLLDIIAYLRTLQRDVPAATQSQLPHSSTRNARVGEASAPLLESRS